MALTNDQITAQNFKDFYNHIMPYLNGQPALNYSTDEQIIGSWIDGKPLYQKTVYCEAMPNATSKTVAHGISNASFKKIYGYMYGSQYDITATLPYISKAANDIQIIKVTCDTTNINIVSTHDFSGFVGYVTVCYTKSTD